MTERENVAAIRRLRCNRCNAVLGTAYVQQGRLLVADPKGRKLEPGRGGKEVDAARDGVRHFAKAELDHAQAAEDPMRLAFQGDREMAELRNATRAGIERVRELESGSPELTYEFCCPLGHTPRIQADRLAALVLDAPERDLLLA